MALAGTVAALVDGDDPVTGTQAAGDGIPFAGVAGQPVQQDDRYPRSAPVTAGDADALTDDTPLRPGHSGPSPVGRAVRVAAPEALVSAAASGSMRAGRPKSGNSRPVSRKALMPVMRLPENSMTWSAQGS